MNVVVKKTIRGKTCSKLTAAGRNKSWGRRSRYLEKIATERATLLFRDREEKNEKKGSLFAALIEEGGKGNGEKQEKEKPPQNHAYGTEKRGNSS